MSEINKSSATYLTQSGNTYTLNQDIVLSDNSYFNLNNETFDGNGHTITIDGVTGFSGVFHTISSDVVIKNLGVLATNGSTLSTDNTESGSGWVVTDNTIDHNSLLIQNCYSTGPIASYGGGICGYYCSYGIIIENCYSTGNIDTGAGGIVGSKFGDDLEGYGGYSKIINCFSTGAINGSKAGGITGTYLGSDIMDHKGFHVEIVNCYSTGDINGTSAGGISGSDTADSGTVLYSNCYSTGSFGSGSGVNAGSIFSLSNVGQIYLYNSYSIETPAVGNNVTSYSGNTYTVVDGVLTYSNAGTTTNIYQVSGTPNTFTNNLSSIQGSSGVSLLNGNQTSTVWTTGTLYPIHTYAVTLLLSYNYSLFPPPAVLTQDTYYHTFYQVSQSNPKVMTSYTYDNTKTLIETVDISFGDYTISEVLQIMDNHPYVIGSNDRGTKFPMSVAYCDVYNDSLTSQKQKGVISGVNRQVVNDP